jgi:hypothetical protein
MAHDMTVGGIGGLSYSLLSSQQPHQDATSLLRRRLGEDVVKDKPKTGIDHFSRTSVSNDERLSDSLRKLAARIGTPSGQSLIAPALQPQITPPPTPATPGTATANAGVPALAPISTTAPAVVVSLAAPSAPAPSEPAPSTTVIDPATSTQVADSSTTTPTDTSTTSSGTTSSTTSSANGKSSTAPGHAR